MTNIDDLTVELSNAINSDNPNYINLLDIHNRVNSLKINTIILKMNEYINQSNTILIFNSLPLYINYILSLLDGNYPSIKKKIKQIEELFNLLNLYNIHPLIIQPLIINIIYSIYISDICSNPDIINNELISLLQSIKNNIELIFSSFTNIFDEIDNTFNIIEDNIGYNKIANLSYNQHNKLFNDIQSNDQDSNNILKLNIMIIQIEHQIYDDIDKYKDKYLDINSILDKEDNILKNKLKLDKDIYDDLKPIYNKFININHNYITRFECFENMQNIDFQKFFEKNIIYYWIEYISYLNNNIIQKIFKK